MLKDLLKTSNQELLEVISGNKPAALGYWENLPEEILSYSLLSVYGRFYDMAIAKTQENLNRVVAAYYMPLSLDADIALGQALGYSEENIILYTKKMFYPKVLPKVTKKERTYCKLIAEIQKVGINNVVEQTMLAISGDKNSLHLIEKECLDLNYVIEILLNMLKEKK